MGFVRIQSGQTIPEERRAREIEDELLREYLPVILGNFERILETPRYFFCQPGSAFLSCSFFYGGGGPIPLGVLAVLWDSGEMIFDCPTCAGRLYAVGLHRLLGGSGTVWGVCAGCRRWKESCHDHLVGSSHAVGEIVARLPQRADHPKGKPAGLRLERRPQGRIHAGQGDRSGRRAGEHSESHRGAQGVGV